MNAHEDTKFETDAEQAEYDAYQADIHAGNTMVSSWRNCPCDECREIQAEGGLPMATFEPARVYRPIRPGGARPTDFVQPAKPRSFDPGGDYSKEPPF